MLEQDIHSGGPMSSPDALMIPVREGRFAVRAGEWELGSVQRVNGGRWVREHRVLGEPYGEAFGSAQHAALTMLREFRDTPVLERPAHYVKMEQP